LLPRYTCDTVCPHTYRRPSPGTWCGATPTALHCTALHCTALHCTALHCTTDDLLRVRGVELHQLHCTALHCTALHSTTLHCTALHCTTDDLLRVRGVELHQLHCTVLDHTALHCTALHCTALHCTALQTTFSGYVVWSYNNYSRLADPSRPGGRAEYTTQVQCSAVQCSAVQCSEDHPGRWAPGCSVGPAGLDWQRRPH
jgi:hypothetical protein